MTETSKHKQPTTSEHPYVEAPRRVARPIRANVDLKRITFYGA
jgi:hypothetical protein